MLGPPGSWSLLRLHFQKDLLRSDLGERNRFRLLESHALPKILGDPKHHTSPTVRELAPGLQGHPSRPEVMSDLDRPIGVPFVDELFSANRASTTALDKCESLDLGEDILDGGKLPLSTNGTLHGKFTPRFR